MADEIAKALLAAELASLPIPGTFTPQQPNISFGERMRGFSHAISGDIQDSANSVASALMAPGNALRGEYNEVEIMPDGSVNPVNSALIAQALNMAMNVGGGSSVVPRPYNSIGMGGRISGPKTFDEYVQVVNPGNISISARDRPNLGMGDMYGMLPKGSRRVEIIDGGELGPISIMRGSDGAYYATGKNPDIMETDVFGYAMPRGDMLELAVVNEAQNKGIGSALQYHLRKEQPYHLSGGLTEQGKSALRRTYERLVKEGVL